jgi:hypothetical protein
MRLASARRPGVEAPVSCERATVQSIVHWQSTRTGHWQVRFITRPTRKSRTPRTMRATRQLFATSEVMSLESSYARIIREDTAEPTPNLNVAENHNDVLQAATSNLLIRGSPRDRDHFFNCARAGTCSQAFETAPCKIYIRSGLNATWSSSRKSPREAEVDLESRSASLKREQQWCMLADPQATPERPLPPPKDLLTISDPLIFFADHSSCW